MALSKIIASRHNRRTTLIPFPGTVDDGSTLSLDFTTGVLDPRLTFTRSTNATFINSQGLVQYANHNLWYNTAFSGLTGTNPTLPASGWNYAGTTGSGKDIVFNGDGSVTTKTPSGTLRCGLQRTTSITNTTLLLAVSLDVVADANATYGTLTASDLVSEGSATDIAFYIDGVNLPASTVITGPCNLTWVFQKTGGGTVTPFFGANIRGAKSGAFTIRFANPRFGLWGGVAPFPYFANTSTTAERHDPRFDYDPSTTPPQPRGLLIEGTANNLATYSNDFANAVWLLDNSGAANPAVSTVSQTGPDGAATVTRITFNKTGGTFSRIRNTAVGSASQPYTMSVWMKANTASGGAATQNVGIRIGADPAGFNCVVTTTWKRFQYTYTLSGTDANAQIMLWDNIVGNDETADVLVYGCQIEAGSGASSYIPTGASTGNRAQDLVSVTLTDFSSWWTSNNPASFLLDFSSTQRPSTNRIIRIADSGGSAFGYSVYFNSSTMPQQVRAVLSSASSSDISIGTNLAANTRTKVGFTIETAALKRFRDGSLASTLSSPSLPPNTMTQMYIGGNPTFGNSSADFCLRSFKYWPTTLADATMQILTT